MQQSQESSKKVEEEQYDEQDTQAEALTTEQLLHIQNSLIELAHDAILLRDPQSHVLLWNQGAQELYGWTQDAVIGKVTHVLLQTRFPESQAAVDAALEEQGQWEGELIHTRSNGTQVVVESRQVLIRDEEGQPIATLEVNRDISARKAELARITHEAYLEQLQTREHLKNSQRRLELAQRVGHIGTFEWDIQRNRIDWTPELEALYGLPPGGFEGKYENWVQHVHPEDLPLMEENLQQAASGGPPYNVEFRVIWPDGTIHWLLGKGEVFTHDAEGRPSKMIGVNIDITERKEAEEQIASMNQSLQDLNTHLEEMVAQRTTVLHQLNTELQRSNQELQDFAYVASHDLQEPLRKIQAFGNLLEEEHGEALGDGKAYLDRMRQAAGRMRTLINDLLTFSRVTTKAQPFTEVDLNTIAREVVEDLEALIIATQAEVEIDPLPTIEADSLQMRQMLQNLIGNALKFHRPGIPPTVTISAEVVTEQESVPLLAPEIIAPAEDAVTSSGALQSYCRLSVQDNGIGFDEKYLDRIFTVFQRLHGKSDYEGSGIGLAVVRKIVERHGGTITARSIPGQGSTFLVILPLTHGEREESRNDE